MRQNRLVPTSLPARDLYHFGNGTVGTLPERSIHICNGKLMVQYDSTGCWYRLAGDDDPDWRMR